MRALPPIVHQDDHLLVLDKPSGLLSIPGRAPELADSLWTRLRQAFPDREVLLVHRLDRDTSGLILFALDRGAQAAMGRLFERREIHKEYTALVHGIPTATRGLIDAPLRKDWTRNDPPVHIVDPLRGKPALTRWEVIAAGGEEARLRLLPETGRSHQLRVHLRQIGHPIVGDPIYGPHPPQGPMRLCATALSFTHPLRHEPLHLRISPPF